MLSKRLLFPLVSVVLLLGLAASAVAQGLTIQIGSAPLPPVPLVNHSNTWHYRYGTNTPPIGWQTQPDAALDSSWLIGPGGFGYEDNDDATVLTNMFNRFTTLYIRQTFAITENVDPARRLQLIMDYDDGYVAWLDGVEVARSPNAPNAPGVEPAYNATTAPGQNHEAQGYQGLPLTTNDLGLVGSRLAPGTHVLAVMGINSATNSGDFSLIADLRLTGGQDTVAEGAFFTLVRSNIVTLSGSNTLANSTRVTVNGIDASFDPVTRIWSKAHSLTPGFNRLFVAALDEAGGILGSQTSDVVCEMASTLAGGMLTANTTWTPAQGIVRVTNDVIVPAGITLAIQPGTVVLMSATASLRATTNGIIQAAGNAAHPIYFLPADGTTPWREISARGAGAAATLQHAELVAGQVIAHPNSTVAIEDSLLRDFRSGSRLFLTATNAQQFAVRRCHIARYDQIRFATTPIRIEDSLFEEVGSDATDLADHSDIVIRRTTYRFGAGSNTDALDLGGNPGILIENCLIHDFPDKGVSVAAQSHGTVVRGSLIYNNGIGIACYSASNCVFSQNTIADCTAGFSLYVRSGFPGPGLAVGSNNIVWGNVTNIHQASGGAIQLAYSDVEGSIWPGTGNLSTNPLFVDPDIGDYRLSPGSSAAGAGYGGENMGALFPVGGIPPAPFNAAAHAAESSPIQIWWQENADNEGGFEIERSIDSTNWSTVASVGANDTNCTDSTTALDQLYFYRVRATNSSGVSRFSNVTSAIHRTPQRILGGILTNDTVLSPSDGLVIVSSTVTVPTNITLTALAGTAVKVTNGASLRASRGGTIRIEGTVDLPVRFSPLNGSNLWGELSAQFTGSSLVIRHADIAGAQVTVYSNATLVLEDSYLHDYRVLSGGTIFNQPLVLAQHAQPTTIRRCIFREYYEILLRNGQHLVEDCLFEHTHGDALDFDSAHPGTVLRRCTFRHGNSGNIDAVDVGPDSVSSRGVIIEDCLMYDFPYDKGVSIGENSFDITVRNCLMHHVSKGVQVKDVSTASVYHNTILHAEIGLHGYEKFAGTGAGRLTNGYNNILWHVTNAIVVGTNSIMNVTHTDMQDFTWPGEGNFDADPQFVYLAGLDCRLQPGSPCLGAGRDGANVGATLPVGAPMAPSNPRVEAVEREASGVTVRFWADSERSYTVQSSDRATGGSWIKVADVYPQLLPRRVAILDSASTDTVRFYRLVSPAEPSP